MTAYDPSTPPAPADPSAQRAGARVRALARSGARSLARPYLELRAREHDLATRLARVEAELEQLRDRDEERLQRLEDLTRETVIAVERLRKRIDSVEPGGSVTGGEPPAAR